MKPTLKQVQEWRAMAYRYADKQNGNYNEADELAQEKFAELAAQWGAEQAQQTPPQGFALVPLVMTRAMEYVTEQEDWQWTDLLAAAEAVTEKQYVAAQAQQTNHYEAALRKVLSAVNAYLPPDGIGAQECLNRVIAAVDPWPVQGDQHD